MDVDTAVGPFDQEAVHGRLLIVRSIDMEVGGEVVEDFDSLGVEGVGEGARVLVRAGFAAGEGNEGPTEIGLGIDRVKREYG